MQTSTAALRQRATRLAWFTVGWDAVEGIVAVTAGLLAGSIALVGFGIDSSIEVFAAGVVVWQLKKPEDQGRQRLALRLIGTTFFALAAYVTRGSPLSLDPYGPASGRLTATGRRRRCPTRRRTSIGT